MPASTAGRRVPRSGSKSEIENTATASSAVADNAAAIIWVKDLDGRYLLEQTDYRAIFWEILRDHMGASPPAPDAIFPGYTSLGLASQELGLIA